MPSSPSAWSCWGYGGVLSLGQGVFFGLGGYAMAMFLKLEASDPISTKIQSTPGIPDFMDWNQLTALPVVGAVPHLPFTLAGVIAVPGAGLRHRLRHVQAARGRRVLRHHHAGRGADPHRADHRPAGLHRRRQRHHRPQDLLGWDIRTDSAKLILYFVNVALLFGASRCAAGSSAASSARCCWPCATRKTACASPATTWPCSRSSCSAWPRAVGIGGAMFTLQVGFMSPSFVGIVPSIEMVIYAAVGGRMSLVGAVYGTLLVNFGKTYFSESFPTCGCS
jgi:urea transport system permease protein